MPPWASGDAARAADRAAATSSARRSGGRARGARLSSATVGSKFQGRGVGSRASRKRAIWRFASTSDCARHRAPCGATSVQAIQFTRSGDQTQRPPVRR